MTVVVDWITASFIIVGLAFCLIASIGLLRMPDLYNRMQAATKAGTLGTAAVITGTALHFSTSTTVIEAGLIIVFFFGTAPIASHLVARAAYGIGIRLDDRTNRDDLAAYRRKQAESGTGSSANLGADMQSMRFADHTGRRSA